MIAKASRQNAGAALLLCGLLCAVLPGFVLVQSSGPCYDFARGGLVFARLSMGLHLPVPIVQNCQNAALLFAFFYVGFVISAAGTLLLLSTRISSRVLWMLTPVAFALAMAMPYVPNSDPYAYALYAYIPAVAHHSPYALVHLTNGPPVASSLDTLLPERKNPIRIANYGPVAVGLYAALTGPFGLVSLKAMILAERVLGAACVLILALLIAMAQNGAGTKRQMFAAIALNPLLLFESISFAHGDIVMLVLLAAAYVAYGRDRMWQCAALCVLATETRSVAIVAVLALFWDLTARKRFADLGSAVIATAVTLVATCAFANYALGGVGHASGFFFSAANAPGTLIAALLFGNWPNAFITGIIIGLALGLVVVYLSLRERFYALLPIAILVALPGIEPWYAQWLAPIAAVTANYAYRAALIAFMLLAPLNMFIDMTVQENYPLFHGLAVAFTWMVPLLIYFGLTLRRPVGFQYDTAA